MQQLVGAHFSEHGLSASRRSENVLGECEFFFDEGVDALFDGALADEFVDEDVLLLADAEGAIGGLIFDGGIPPTIEVDDVAGGGEIEAGAAGFH